MVHAQIRDGSCQLKWRMSGGRARHSPFQLNVLCAEGSFLLLVKRGQSIISIDNYVEPFYQFGKARGRNSQNGFRRGQFNIGTRAYATKAYGSFACLQGTRNDTTSRASKSTLSPLQPVYLT